MTTLIAPTGTKSCFVDGTTYIVDAKGRVSVPASAVPSLIAGGFVYDPTTANLRAKIAAGASANSNIAVSGIKTTDEVIGSVNLTDGSNVVVSAVAATLSLATVASTFDTVLEASAAGAAGNAKKIALVSDDGALKAGSSSWDAGAKTLTLTMKGGTSTVGDMESLITAAAATTGIAIKTGGTGGTVLAANKAFAATPLAGGADAYDELPTITSDGNVQHTVNTSNKKLLVIYSTH